MSGSRAKASDEKFREESNTSGENPDQAMVKRKRREKEKDSCQ